ncbi:hypothetical protein HDU97_002551 [Phlyctochytrium planicorne]|nr:hypothetical protein HDU97_002551 [Phlyctochytrium planicorne]
MVFSSLIITNLEKEAFEDDGETIRQVSLTHLVHYTMNEDAGAAKMQLDRTQLAGSEIRVFWGEV